MTSVSTIARDLKIKRALISVTDKTGLDKLAQFLHEYKIEIISTGGTQKFIENLNIPVTSVESITQNPEAFGGRMKSISFQISSSLLFRRDHAEDLVQADKLKIKPIDLVICNLYPFENYTDQNTDTDVLVENIDIGGPLMLRSAAKNFNSVAVLSDVNQYSVFMLHYMQNNNAVALDYRKDLAVKTFRRISEYDLAISLELTQKFEPEKTLRYGENPHQKAVVYPFQNTTADIKLIDAKILQGKELSYNNWLDSDAAWRIVSDVHLALEKTDKKYVCAVIKHSNPCGLAASLTSDEALDQAWMGDAISSFGGIIATNFKIEAAHAKYLTQNFIEVLIAPDFSLEALEIFKTKKNVRLLKTPLRLEAQKEKMIRSISGGLLIQNEDEFQAHPENLKQVTEAQFTQDQNDISIFGILACKHLKSNGIALVSKNKNSFILAGAGMGQPNRLDSLRLLAVHRLNSKNIATKDVVLVSDAFFPFADSIEICGEIGVTAIIQPGGSIKDSEVIAKCNDLKIAMKTTGQRHFRH